MEAKIRLRVYQDDSMVEALENLIFEYCGVSIRSLTG
jgi:hypothetical protein